MPDKSNMNSSGGQQTATVAAATAGLALTGPGRICRIVIHSVGSAVTPIYDNTSATGTIVYTVAASPAIGTNLLVDLPVTNGIFIGGGTNTSALTLSYTTDNAYGR
jgi:hypothetical protein